MEIVATRQITVDEQTLVVVYTAGEVARKTTRLRRSSTPSITGCDISRVTRPLPSVKGCIHRSRWWAAALEMIDSVLPSLEYTWSKRSRKRGRAPGLMATWVPTCTSRLRHSPGTTRSFSFGGRIFDPEKILGQQFTEAPVNFPDAFRLDSKASLEATAVDPFLHGDMRFGFQLKVALAGVLAIFILERPLDIHRVRIVAFDEVGVVAVHRTHQLGERSQ
jgi:hypothetical protein